MNKRASHVLGNIFSNIWLSVLLASGCTMLWQGHIICKKNFKVKKEKKFSNVLHCLWFACSHFDRNVSVGINGWIGRPALVTAVPLGIE